MRYVPLIDATGYQSVKEIVKIFKERGIKVIISGVNENLRKDFKKNDMFSILKKEFVVKDITTAIKLANEI